MRPHRRALTPLYAARGDSVPSEPDLSAWLGNLARPDAVAFGLALGRVGIGAVFLAAPVLSVRVLGVDTATARRIRFLARMAAARDIALGAGVLTADAAPDAAPWLLAGAAADLVDAVVITAAVRQGALRRLPAGAVALGAAVAAAAGTWAALRLRRG